MYQKPLAMQQLSEQRSTEASKSRSRDLGDFIEDEFEMRKAKRRNPAPKRKLSETSVVPKKPQPTVNKKRKKSHSAGNRDDDFGDYCYDDDEDDDDADDRDLDEDDLDDKDFTNESSDESPAYSSQTYRAPLPLLPTRTSPRKNNVKKEFEGILLRHCYSSNSKYRVFPVKP
jgi:hypothetical protein